MQIFHHSGIMNMHDVRHLVMFSLYILVLFLRVIHWLYITCNTICGRYKCVKHSSQESIARLFLLSNQYPTQYIYSNTVRLANMCVEVRSNNGAC